MTWVWHDTPALPTAVNRRFKALELELAEIRQYMHTVIVARDGDTTPSVRNTGVLYLNNSGATTITAFDDGRIGQLITVFFGDGNTTLQHGTALRLDGAVNFVASAGDLRQFRMVDGDGFRETPQG